MAAVRMHRARRKPLEEPKSHEGALTGAGQGWRLYTVLCCHGLKQDPAPEAARRGKAAVLGGRPFKSTAVRSPSFLEAARGTPLSAKLLSCALFLIFTPPPPPHRAPEGMSCPKSMLPLSSVKGSPASSRHPPLFSELTRLRTRSGPGWSGPCVHPHSAGVAETTGLSQSIHGVPRGQGRWPNWMLKEV